MLRTSKRRRLSPDTCLPVLTRSELRWLDRSGPLNSCSWKEPVPSPSFSSDCHDALPNRHDPPYWWPDMGPKAPWSWVCGETQRSGPQRQKPNVKGWFPLAARVFGFPSKESGGGVGNPQSAPDIVCAAYIRVAFHNTLLYSARYWMCSFAILFITV